MPLAKLRALFSGKKEPRIPDPIWFETLAALPFCGRLTIMVVAATPEDERDFGEEGGE